MSELRYQVEPDSYPLTPCAPDKLATSNSQQAAEIIADDLAHDHDEIYNVWECRIMPDGKERCKIVYTVCPAGD